MKEHQLKITHLFNVPQTKPRKRIYFAHWILIASLSYIGVELESWGERNMATDSWLLKVSNIIAFALTVIINSIAGSTTIIGGVNTAQISDAYPTLITPAGYTFAIWGIIYFLLGVFVVYQALPSQKGKDFQKKIGWLFVLSSILNIAWIFCWQYQQLAISVVLIFMLLLSLIAIYLRLGIGRSAVRMRERLAVHLPFSVYLGWITIATIADVAVTLVSVQWGGFGIAAETWALLIIVVALLITLVVIATRKDIGYGLVIIWALVGIAVKQMGYPTIVMTLEASIIIIAIALVVMILYSTLWHRPKSPTAEETKSIPPPVAPAKPTKFYDSYTKTWFEVDPKTGQRIPSKN
jgi:hypothetical protein